MVNVCHINAVAGYLKELLTRAKLDLNLVLVQTAYANGSSTKYIKDQLVNQEQLFLKLH